MAIIPMKSKLVKGRINHERYMDSEYTKQKDFQYFKVISFKNGDRYICLNIHDYGELLQRLEDAEDLAELKKLRRGPHPAKAVFSFNSSSAIDDSL